MHTEIYLSVPEKAGFQSPYTGMDNGMVSTLNIVHYCKFKLKARI